MRKREDVHWTFLSPAANFVVDGVRTGQYIKGGKEYFVNAAGQSEISYADYAIAMVDEITCTEDEKKRIAVIGK